MFSARISQQKANFWKVQFYCVCWLAKENPPKIYLLAKDQTKRNENDDVVLVNVLEVQVTVSVRSG